MYVFTPMRGSPICHVLLTVLNTHRQQTRQQTIHWIFTQTKLNSNYRLNLAKPVVTYWTLKKR